MIDYFKQPIEQYYYINLIPELTIFGHSISFSFYLAIIVLLVFFLFFKKIFFLKSLKKNKFFNVFIYFLFVFLFLFIAKWMSIQMIWLKNDYNDFYGKDFKNRQNKILTRIIKSTLIGLPEQWYNFFNFLQFSKNQLPKKSSVYVLPYHKSFQVWAKYYLYPDLILVNSSKQADYVLSFNVDLPKNILEFQKFKEFEPKKLILKRIIRND